MTEEHSTKQAISSVKFDADDPYRGVDISKLPSWWRSNIREFEANGLRTYLPSLFADGAIVQLIIERLAAEYKVDIRLVGAGVRYGDNWDLRVDGETVASLERRRDRAGYTVFEISSDEIKEMVEEIVLEGDT
jgi:hypothetical protein